MSGRRSDGSVADLDVKGVVVMRSISFVLDVESGRSRLISSTTVTILSPPSVSRTLGTADVSTKRSQGKLVFDTIRPPESRDPFGVEEARKMLETSYECFDQRNKGRTWAVGEAFSMADCAAAPSLFYADWTHRIPEKYDALTAYRTRLLERPSFARVVDEARKYRHYFPLGAPDRD